MTENEFEVAPNEPVPQSIQAPVETAPMAAPAPTPSAPANGNASGVDVQSLNETLDQQLRALGKDYSMAALPDKVKALQKGMYEAQEKAARLERQVREAEFRQQARYQPPVQQPQIPMDQMDDPSAAPWIGAINHLATRQQQAEERQVRQELRQLVDELGVQYPEIATEDVRRELIVEAIATENYDLQGMFLKKYSHEIANKAAAAAVAKTMAGIQQNATAYPHGAPTTAVPSPVNPLDMTPDQQEAWFNEEMARIQSQPGYADKLAEHARNGF